MFLISSPEQGLLPSLGLELDEHKQFVFDTVGFNAQDDLVCKRCNGDGVTDLNPDGLAVLEACWHCKGSGLHTPFSTLDTFLKKAA